MSTVSTEHAGREDLYSVAAALDRFPARAHFWEYLSFCSADLPLLVGFGSAVFGSFACLEGLFPQVFPFALMKGVDLNPKP